MTPDEQVKLLKSRWSQLMALAARWCRVCRLAPVTSAEDLLFSAIERMLSEKNAVEDPLLYVESKIRQLACNKARRHKIQQEADAAVTFAEEQRAAPRADTLAADKEVAGRIMGILFSLAHNHDDTTSLLMAMDDAFSRGSSMKKEDLMREAGLDARRYRAARDHLNKLLGQLPEDLQNEAVLRGDWV